MYEDIFESIRKVAAKRNLRESTANAYCNSVGYFLRTVNKVPMKLLLRTSMHFLQKNVLVAFLRRPTTIIIHPYAFSTKNF